MRTAFILFPIIPVVLLVVAMCPFHNAFPAALPITIPEDSSTTTTTDADSPVQSQRRGIERLGQGIIHSVKDATIGTVDMITHIIPTLKTTWYGVTHLPETVQTVEHQVVQSFKEDPFYATGYTLGTMGMMAAPAVLSSLKTAATQDAVSAAINTLGRTARTSVIGGGAGELEFLQGQLAASTAQVNEYRQTVQEASRLRKSRLFLPP